MKAPVWMILGLFISILIMDMTKVMAVRGKIISTVEHSLDAALVGGIDLTDARLGRLSVNESRGQALALTFFRDGLKLNGNLENDSLKNTHFAVAFSQNEERPKVSAEVSATITVMSPRLFGLDGIPVTIRKSQYHLQKFK